MRRIAKITAWTLGLILGLTAILIAAVLIGANTQSGRAFIEHTVQQLTHGNVKIEGVGGHFPDDLHVRRIALGDEKGVWLIVDNAVLDWVPTRLIHRELRVDKLAAARVEVKRRPIPSEDSSSSSSFSLPVTVTLGELLVEQLQVDQPIAGTQSVFAVKGRGQLDSLESGNLTLTLQGITQAGTYHADGSITPKDIELSVRGDTPKDGLVMRLLGPTNLEPIHLEARLKGPRTAVATMLALRAGPLKANAQGTLDLVDHAADLSLMASAPAMSPRPDLSWQSVSLDSSVKGAFTRPTANAKLRVAELKAGGGSVGNVGVDVQGDSGLLELDGLVSGLRIPGNNPDVMAGEPLVVKATARLEAQDRPVTLSIQHPLITAHGHAQTADQMRAELFVELPNLAPLASVAGADVQGSSEMEFRASKEGDVTKLDADATLAITGGAQPVPGLLGDSARLKVEASMQGAKLQLSQLLLNGKTIQVAANGGASPKAVDLKWKVGLSNLQVLSADLTGTLQATGKVAGPTDDLAAEADVQADMATGSLPRGPVTVHLDAEGLTKAPSGEVTADGQLAGAPLALVVVASQSAASGLQLDIKQAHWSSARADGRLTLAQGATVPLGTISLRMTRLQDLQPFIGQPIKGSLTAQLNTVEENGETKAEAWAEARGVGVEGTAMVKELTLAATVVNLATSPVVDGSLVVAGLAAQGVNGSGKLTVKGPAKALAIQVAADAQDLQGSPARVSGSAVLDAPDKKVDLSALQANWKGETLKLLAPARVNFADGLSLNDLRVGVHKAVLEASGRLTPTLDFVAHVRNLSPELAAAFAPDLKATGKIRGDAELTGSLDRPKGKVRLEGRGLRLTSGPISALPPADVTAAVDLAGDSARIDSRITAGSKTDLTLRGQTALASGGRMDLRAAGSIDLTILDPVLTATGERVTGRLKLDVGLTGTLADPRLGGDIQLVQGSFQDYAQGVHLADINSQIQLKGQEIRIARLTATAGPGSVSASGTIGALIPGVPVDVRVTANNARPLASDLVTANLNADLSARGHALEQFLVSGNIHIKKAELRIPQTMPMSVATLDVRRLGDKPPPAQSSGPTINLDLTLDAPRQIYVRGRGLDAELGGQIGLKGTAASPQPLGSFNLIRGQLSLAGQALTFSKGKVSFSGGGLTDPSLDFAVTSSNGNVTAELAILGTVSDPKISMSSTPTLPQDEVLAQLLFNRSASDLSPLELAQIAAVLAELTGATAGLNPLGKVREALGLSQLSIGTGADGKAALKAGRYVAPNVYVGVEQGTSGGSTDVKVQVDLTNHLKLEGKVGASSSSAAGTSQEEGSSIGATYEFEY